VVVVPHDVPADHAGLLEHGRLVGIAILDASTGLLDKDETDSYSSKLLEKRSH
jgi:hypothetical protein